MSSHDEHQRGPTPPRGWRPGPLFIAAACFAIVLLIVWLALLALTPSNSVEPQPNPATAPSAPAR